MMKKKVKINFADFWKAWNKTDNPFWNLLSRKYDLELSEKPDILFYSYFGNEFRNYDCIRVLFQGENVRPNFKECDFAFSFDHIPDNPRNYRLPLYYLYDDVNKLTSPKDPEKIAASKTKFCAFVFSNKYCSKRNNFFKKLSKYKKVDSGGAVFNNIGGKVENKLNFIKDYKFTIAFENSSYPGYTTEKIFQPMLVNSIPIYWGNPLVYEDFNTKSFINFHDYKNEEELIEKIIEVDQNPDLYLEMLSQPYFPNNELNEYVKEENILKQLDYIVDSIQQINPVANRYKLAPIWVKYTKRRMMQINRKLIYFVNSIF